MRSDNHDGLRWPCDAEGVSGCPGCARRRGGGRYAGTPTAGQAPLPRIPRTAGGKPNLNGIWQALNTANYDLEAHVARPALAMRARPVLPGCMGPGLLRELRDRIHETIRSSRPQDPHIRR